MDAPAPTAAFEKWQAAALRESRHSSVEDTLRMEIQAVEATRAWLVERRIQFAEVLLKDAKHPSFHLLPGVDSPLNLLSKELLTDLPGIRLVYSPTDLMRGSAGFFSENDSVMGISHAMFSSGVADETFNHEVIHAAHFLGRKQGQIGPLNPYAKLLVREPGRSIGKSRDGYLRLQTFEEIEAYIESVAYSALQLRPYLGRKLTPKEFDAVEEILNAMHFQCEVGGQVARQSRELAASASSEKAWATDSGWVPIPEQPSFWRRAVRIDAYTAEIANRWTIHPEGTEFVWRIASSAKPTIQAAELRALLGKSVRAADLVEGEFARVKSKIYWMIERADAERTDLQSVVDAVDELDRLFYRWKKTHGRIAIPTLFDGR